MQLNRATIEAADPSRQFAEVLDLHVHLRELAGGVRGLQRRAREVHRWDH